MSNPYGQIFLTYTRRKMFWLVSVLALCGSVGMLGFLGDAHHRQQIIATYMPHVGFGFPLLYFFGFLIVHLKQQIATPYASLLPRYRPPHLVVAALLAAPTLLLVPVIISLFLNLPILPLLGLNLVFCALLAWAIYRGTVPLLALVLACWFSPALPAVHVFLSRFLTEDSLPTTLLSLLFLTAGILGFAALAHRLLHLSEEMPEYARNVSTNRWDTLANFRRQRTAPQIDYQSRWAMFFMTPNESQLARVSATPNPNFWQRVARWRTAQGNRRATALVPAWYVLFSTFIFDAHGDTSKFNWFLVLIFPVSMVLGQLLRRLPLLGSESLRPVSRRAFLIENAMASALHLAELWLVTATLLLLQIAWLAPASLYTPTPWLNLATVALFQILYLAIAFWLLRFRSPMLLWCPSLCILTLFPILAILSQRTFPFSPAAASLIAALVLLVSLLIFLDAYRRWLNTDLD